MKGNLSESLYSISPKRNLRVIDLLFFYLYNQKCLARLSNFRQIPMTTMLDLDYTIVRCTEHDASPLA